MTKEELLKLEPGTLVDVTVDGKYWGYNSLLSVVELPNDEGVRAYVAGWGMWFSLDHISLHVPQPQVSGTIETPPKLYTLHTTSWNPRNATPATDAEIMAQECVRESRNTIAVLNEEIAKRNEQIHKLSDGGRHWAEVAQRHLDRVKELEAKLANELGRTIWAQSQVSILEAKIDELEAPPSTDEVKHAYDSLIVAGYKDEARVLQTLSHVVERLSEQIKEDECSSNK